MANSTTKGDQPEIYFEDDVFDYGKFKDSYDNDNLDLTSYRYKCSKNKDLRDNRWAGKSDDLKKTSENAVPHRGAADTENWIIDRAIQNYTAMTQTALKRSKIVAGPREASEAARSASVSVMLRWMRDSGIPNYSREMELAASFGAEKGLMVTYCGWAEKARPVMKRYDLEKIMETLPELDPVMQQTQVEFVEMLADEDRVEEVVELFSAVDGWEVNPKRVKKALKQLRRDGVADIPFISRDGGTFDVRTLAPDADFIMPAFTMNPQDAPRMTMRMLLTGQDLQNAASSDGWDQGWVDAMIDNHTGMSASKFRSPTGDGTYTGVGYGVASPVHSTAADSRDLIEVLYTYERLIEKEDGAEGIYLTIWSREFGGREGFAPPHAKRILLSGRKTFPFVVTPLAYTTKTIYDSPTYPQMLKSAQKIKKTTQDAYVDESEWAINPAMYGAPGTDLSQVGPGARGNFMTGREPKFIAKPSQFEPSIKLDQMVTDEANEHIGQAVDNPYSQIRNQHEINRLLEHAQGVLAMEYEVYKLEGPDELFFRVSGQREPTQFIKEEDEAEMDVQIAFNTQQDDPDWLKNTMDALDRIRANDPSGLIDSDKVNMWALSAIDPMLGEMVTSDEATGSAKITAQTTDDISKMHAGIPVGAPQNAPQARLQVVMDYGQSIGGQAALAGNLVFDEALGEYAKQLNFQISQTENAQIGRIGGEPAAMGSTSTQEIGGQ
jgi:hypothetical protein